MKLAGILLVVVLAIAGASWKFGGGPDAQAQDVSASSLATVTKGDLVITVTENGYLKAKNSVKIKPEFNGSAEISWLIEEGETVDEGAVLVEFDKTEVEENIVTTENRLIQHEMELEAANANLEIQKRDNTAAKEKNALALDTKRKELERYELGDAPNSRRKMELAAEKAKSQYERTKEQFESVPELAAEGFLTKIQVEEERIRLRESEINSENAAKDLELWLTYTYPMDFAQKKSAVRDAERDQENAGEKATINLREKEARVKQTERQVESVRKRLEELKEELSHMTITSPGHGIVHYGDPERPWRRDEVEVGNRFRRGNVIATLPDLTEMQVLIQVHEADIGLLDEDQIVNVSVDTVKGHVFAGRVTEIASVATSHGWGSEGQSFQVEVTMEAGEVELKAGVTARAEVLVETIPDTVQVPIHAIIAEEGKHFCFVYANGAIEERTVEIGRNNAHFVAVTSGLEEGEKVLLYDPRHGGFSSPDGDASGTESDDAEGGLSSDLSGMGGTS